MLCRPPRTINKWLYRLIQVAFFALLFLSFAPLLSERFSESSSEDKQVSSAAEVVEMDHEPPVAAASPDLSSEDLASPPVEAEPIPSLDLEPEGDLVDAPSDPDDDLHQEVLADQVPRDDDPAPPAPADPPAEILKDHSRPKKAKRQQEHPLKPFVHISLAALSSVLALLPGVILWRRRQTSKASAVHKAGKERLAQKQALAASKEIWANPGGSQGRAVRQYEAEEELLVKKEEESIEVLTSSTSTIKQEPDEVVRDFNLCFIGEPLNTLLLA